jgi:hypothetical protein
MRRIVPARLANVESSATLLIRYPMRQLRARYLKVGAKRSLACVRVKTVKGRVSQPWQRASFPVSTASWSRSPSRWSSGPWVASRGRLYPWSRLPRCRRRS